MKSSSACPLRQNLRYDAGTSGFFLRKARENYIRTVRTVSILLIVTIVALLAACNPDEINGSGSIPPGNIETIAGVGREFDYSGDGGAATEAHLGFVTGVATDRAGDVYLVDGAANVVRKLNRADGKIVTLTGTFLGFNIADPTPHAGDGGLASLAHLYVPYGIAVDANSNIYIADAGNNVIRRIESSTGKMTLYAGNYTQPAGYAGDGGGALAAAFHTPYDVAADKGGDLYIVDKDNHVIRRVAANSGNITTVAGSGPEKAGYAGDNGLATDARLHSPQGIAVAGNGDLYIADAGNHVIRRVDMNTGKIFTYAGNGTVGFSGDNGPANEAQLSSPARIALDAAGNLFIADHGNHVIRKVDASGTISTIVGTGTPGYSGDGGRAVDAQLSSPYGVAVDKSGNIVFSDNGNSVIRAVTN